MGINITDKGLRLIDSICNTIESTEHERNVRIKASHILRDTLSQRHFKAGMFEQELIDELGCDLLHLNPGEDVKVKLVSTGLTVRYGRFMSGGWWILRSSPAGRVGKNWHRKIMREIGCSPGCELKDELFKIGQQIIDGIEQGYRT